MDLWVGTSLDCTANITQKAKTTKKEDRNIFRTGQLE